MDAGAGAEAEEEADTTRTNLIDAEGSRWVYNGLAMGVVDRERRGSNAGLRSVWKWMATACGACISSAWGEEHLQRGRGWQVSVTGPLG